MKSLVMPLALALAATTGSFVLTVDTAIAGPTFTGVEDSNIAAGGYDVTSYFSESGVPAKGSKAHTVSYNGAEYQFSSASNASKFEENPAKFAPQYGGHCAWAMSRGYLAPGDPLLSKVVDGKLYLNFNRDVQKTWLSDIPGFINKANVEWPKFPDDAKFGA